MDALLGLLDLTGDALAATWDQRSEMSDEESFQAIAGLKASSLLARSRRASGGAGVYSIHAEGEDVAAGVGVLALHLLRDM